MISLNKRITAISLTQWADTKDLIKGIRNKKGYYIKSGYSIPLINNLEIKELFKDKNRKKGVNVTNLINRIV